MVAKKEFVLSKQLLKSGTSIGANIEEAQAAESKKDFIHKTSIALKEARETKYWLLLLEKSERENSDYKKHLGYIEEIIRILVTIIKSSIRNIKKQSES